MESRGRLYRIEVRVGTRRNEPAEGLEEPAEPLADPAVFSLLSPRRLQEHKDFDIWANQRGAQDRRAHSDTFSRTRRVTAVWDAEAAPLKYGIMKNVKGQNSKKTNTLRFRNQD